MSWMSRLLPRSLRVRLILAFGFVIFLTVFLTGLTTVYLLREQQERNARERVGLLAELVAMNSAFLEVQNATPMQIRDALRLTASQATNPDALMGWGIVDAVAAHDWLSATDVVMAPPRANALTSFPNPFNPATTISWRLDRPAFVTLRIYDPRGRLVRTLASRTATVHSALWDGRDESGHTLPSGVYLCRLHASEAGRTVATLNRKLTLLE